jgi:hypothetical protein
MGNGRSSGLLASIAFCPSCGCRALREDDYGRSGKRGRKGPSGKRSWICDSCGLGFRVLPSQRHEMAMSLIRDHRVGRYMDDARNRGGTWAVEEVDKNGRKIG